MHQLDPSYASAFEPSKRWISHKGTTTYRNRAVQTSTSVTPRTLYYPFSTSVNTLLTCSWSRVQKDPFLYTALPTPPFLARKNHLYIGQVLSHNLKSVSHSNTKNQQAKAQTGLDQGSPTYEPKVHRSFVWKPSLPVCPQLLHPNYVASTTTKMTHPVDTTLHCRSQGVVYLFTCRRCNKQYVGQTGRSMEERFASHRHKFRTAPMSLYSHFLHYHHTDSLDVTTDRHGPENPKGARMDLIPRNHHRPWVKQPPAELKSHFCITFCVFPVPISPFSLISSFVYFSV